MLGINKIILVITIKYITSSDSSDVFHQKSRTAFYPDLPATYFGYAVVLTNSSLIVGAPKATSRENDKIARGLVFTCPLNQLETANVTCTPVAAGENAGSRLIGAKDFFRHDMWFGATIAAVPEGKLLACAPRWADPYKDKHLLANGACYLYLEARKREITLTPLKENSHLAFRTDGARKEYGEYGTHLNFYAYGQAGMSVKVTENNSFIIGAPGLMQWTGGIIDYKFNSDRNSVYFSKQQITNPYFTKELGPDDYFGYSVESGIFEQNGSVLYVAGAPRSKMGFGQVLIFEPPTTRSEFDPLNVHAKLRGPQLGSYFGATLCVTDLNGDGNADLLVGAPNYVKTREDMPFDQGAVFVYLTGHPTCFMSGSELLCFINEGWTTVKKTPLVLKAAGFVSGNGENGARFGTSIAALGDVDGDGYNDVAIGAPWENEGIGAVYIYKGSETGLKDQYLQKIIAEDASGFGMSVARGVDVDGNNCSDLAAGAYASGTAYLYRCVPSIEVKPYIKVPDAMNLPKNVTSFSAHFCVSAKPSSNWADVKIDLIARITIDPEGNRASASQDEYPVTARPGAEICDEQTIEVKPTADLSKPILMKLDLEPKKPLIDDSEIFHKHAARLSGDSVLNTSFLIQLIRDCGDDLICTPVLELTLEAIDSQYVPGTNNRLGVRVKVFNREEPAYGAIVYVRLPLPPKRVPGECSLEDLNMTCNIPAPLEREESVEWEIEMEHTLKRVEEEVLTVEAEVKHPLYIRDENEKTIKEANITVIPQAHFKITGKPLPNVTLTVTREKFYEAENVSFVHYFEVTNLGPSDWPLLEAVVNLPNNISISNIIKGCEVIQAVAVKCLWSLPAKTSISITLLLKYDLKKYGTYFDEQSIFNATSILTLLLEQSSNLNITTTLKLDPATPIWPVIVGSIAGFLLLSAIVYGLYKYGFFSRAKHEELKRLQEENILSDGPVCTTSPPSEADDSSRELISESSD